ncbi:MAG: alkanesulfonate monooxygenase, partial [Flavobacteriaceae bacterium]
KSYGVSRQKQMREQSSGNGYVEPHLWTGIGKARSGCGAALVGNPDQIVEKLNRYMDMGIRSFILSGYPHIDECNRFAELVLPRLKTFSMPHLQGKTTKEAPLTPLANGIRV